MFFFIELYWLNFFHYNPFAQKNTTRIVNPSKKRRQRHQTGKPKTFNTQTNAGKNSFRSGRKERNLYSSRAAEKFGEL